MVIIGVKLGLIIPDVKKSLSQFENWVVNYTKMATNQVAMF